MRPNKKVLILFFVLILILLGILILKMNTAGRKDMLPIPSPTFSPTLNSKTSTPLATGYSPDYVKQSELILKSQQPQLEQNQAVGKLLQKLPHQGTNFSMRFDFKTADFIVTINKQDTEKGNTELNQFLKDNSIENRSWVDNLVIE